MEEISLYFRNTDRFDRPIYNERIKEIHFVARIDCLSKFPSAEVFQHAQANSIEKLIQKFTLLHGVQRCFHFDQARCQVGKQSSKFCEQHIFYEIAHRSMITEP